MRFAPCNGHLQVYAGCEHGPTRRGAPMHCRYRLALLGILGALIPPVHLWPATAQDWTPTFKSDEAAVAPEPKRKPIAAKRRFVRPKQQASIRLPTSSTPSRSVVHKLAIQVAEN